MKFKFSLGDGEQAGQGVVEEKKEVVVDAPLVRVYNLLRESLRLSFPSRVYASWSVVS